MSLISIPNVFTVGSVIVASQHNSNFSTIFNDYNGGITTVNLSASAGIVDTQLAAITTAGKVSGAALTSLSSTPAGAGLLPVANVPPVVLTTMVSGILPTANGGTGSSSGVGSLLGTWDYSTYSADTVYQASTDGFVMATVTIQGNAVKSASILTDAATPPTHTTASGSSTSSTTAITIQLMSPVKKTHYWKVSNVAGSSVSQIYWIPLGV